MSPKIFNGYSLPQMSFMGLDLFIKKIRVEIKKAHIELGTSMLIRRAVQLLDLYFIFGGKYIKKLLGKEIKFKSYLTPHLLAYYELDKKAIKAEESTLRKDSMYDFKTDICLFPAQNKILAIFFTQQKKFEEIWRSTKGVTPYPYWNNCDSPDHITACEWNQRCKDWSSVFADSGIPSECGFVVKLVSGFPPLLDTNLFSDEANKYIDSLDKRVEFYAENFVFNEKFKENITGIDTKQIDKIEKIYHQTNRWLKEDGKKLVLTKTEELKKILIPEVTTKTLLTDFEELGKEKRKIWRKLKG